MLQVLDSEKETGRNSILSLHKLSYQGTVPPSCVGAQMITNSLKLYLFGGTCSNKSYNTLYEFDIETSTWSVLTPIGDCQPCGRFGHSMNCVNQTIIIFGGLIPNYVNNEDELFDNILNVPVLPFASFLKDKINFTINNSYETIPTNSLYAFNLRTSSWKTIQPCWEDIDTKSSPCGLSFHSAVILPLEEDDTKETYLVIWGGAKDSKFTQPSNELYIYDIVLEKWCSTPQQVGKVPFPRFGHTMVRLPDSSRLLMLGGLSMTTQLHETNLYILDFCNANFHTDQKDSCTSFVFWSCLETSGLPPDSRFFHSMHILENRLWVLGGLSHFDPECQLKCLDLKNYVWSKPLHHGAMSIISAATAVFHDKLFVFGGMHFGMLSIDWGNTVSYNFSYLPIQLQYSQDLFLITRLSISSCMMSRENVFKLVLVGDSGVGKSSLIKRFVEDHHDDHLNPTVGIDLRKVVIMVKNHFVTVQLWDTAGQERFMGVTSNYYRNADGFLIVFDGSRRESFDNIPKWINEIQQYQPIEKKSLKFVIQNKNDLDCDNKISQQEIDLFCSKIDAMYGTTSARTGYGVDTIFFLATCAIFAEREISNKDSCHPNRKNQPGALRSIVSSLSLLNQSSTGLTENFSCNMCFQ